MKLEEMLGKRAEVLARMKELNAKEELDERELDQFNDYKAKFEKLSRDIDLAKSESTLKSDIEKELRIAKLESATNQADYIKGFDKYLAGKNLAEAMAAMSEGIDSDGGYLVPPSYQKSVTMKLNTLSATRSISTVLGTLSTKNIPTEGDAPTFTWIDELGEYGESKFNFGNKQLGAYKLGGIIKVSEELLQDSMIDFESYMANQIARGIDKAESVAFVIGDGSKKPTGYLNSAPVGANSTTAGSNSVSADELIDIFYDLKEEYRKKATWRMSDKTEKAIRKLKDGEGNYLYSAGLNDAQRSTLLGRPIVIDNAMPELGSGNKFIVLGDFSYFQIVDRGGMSLQRLNELYAGNGMVGFKVHKRVDAKVIIEEAFNAGKNA